MLERRKHKRLPVIEDLAEPIEMSILDENGDIRQIPGVLTNLSAGGLDLVLMGSIEGQPKVRLSLKVSGINRFIVEGSVVWTKTKGPTEILGLKFTKIPKTAADKITRMAEIYWKKKREKKSSHLN